MQSNFIGLPNDILNRLVSYLTPQDLARFRVSTPLKMLIERDSSDFNEQQRAYINTLVALRQGTCIKSALPIISRGLRTQAFAFLSTDEIEVVVAYDRAMAARALPFIKKEFAWRYGRGLALPLMLIALAGCVIANLEISDLAKMTVFSTIYVVIWVVTLFVYALNKTNGALSRLSKQGEEWKFNPPKLILALPLYIAGIVSYHFEVYAAPAVLLPLGYTLLTFLVLLDIYHLLGGGADQYIALNGRELKENNLAPYLATLFDERRRATAPPSGDNGVAVNIVPHSG